MRRWNIYLRPHTPIRLPVLRHSHARFINHSTITHPSPSDLRKQKRPSSIPKRIHRRFSQSLSRRPDETAKQSQRPQALPSPLATLRILINLPNPRLPIQPHHISKLTVTLPKPPPPTLSPFPLLPIPIQIPVGIPVHRQSNPPSNSLCPPPRLHPRIHSLDPHHRPRHPRHP
jgi:hypothetical protein